MRTKRYSDRDSASFQRAFTDMNEAWMNQWDTFVAPAMETWGQMWNDALTSARVPTMVRSNEPRKKHSKHKTPCNCGCECDQCDDCRRDDCQCQCCIVNADVITYAYPGEQRVIPLVIENRFRREKEVKLELSSFEGSKSCPIGLEGGLIGEPSFTLAPCEERKVLIRTFIGSPNDDSTTGDPTRIDECCVFYADLRVTGCDIRPVRIAVAVLPFDCDQYVVDCAYGCC